jgi:membrane protein
MFTGSPSFRGMAMKLSQSAKRLFKQLGPFALAVIKQFRANQGMLLAGAVAYYTLLSLVPLLILVLLALSHIVDEERLLVTLRALLEFVVPVQAEPSWESCAISSHIGR